MKLLLSALIGVAVNLDNMLIGLSLGFRHKQLSITTNAIIAAITGMLTYISCVVATSLSCDILRITNIVGAVILISFGLWCLKNSGGTKETQYKVQSFKEIIIFGWILAANCIPPSFSAGVMGLNSIVLSFCATITAFIFMYVANSYGSKIADTGKFSFLEPLSAWILICIGFMELLV